MTSICITRVHGLSRAQALAAVRQAAQQIAADYGLAADWRGDVVCVRGEGLYGELRLGADRLELEIRLGFFLMFFKDRIVAGIEAELDRRFAQHARKESPARRPRSRAKARTRRAIE